ncbi:MAG: NACHT domain-containing protein [Nitrosotalea sp.]
MNDVNPLKNSIKEVFRTISENPLSDTLMRTALDNIPIIGSFLSELYGQSTDSTNEKIEQIKKLLTNLEGLVYDESIKFCNLISSQKEILTSQNRGLFILSENTHEILFELKNLKTENESNYLKLEINLVKNTLEVVQAKQSIIEKIDNVGNDIGQLDSKLDSIKESIRNNSINDNKSLITYTIDEQIERMKIKIRQDYDNLPDNPLITGFKSLSGNLHVKQGYQHWRNQSNVGDNIINYVLETVDKKLQDIEQRKQFKESLKNEIEKLENVRKLDPILRRRRKLDEKAIEDVLKKSHGKLTKETKNNIKIAEDSLDKISELQRKLKYLGEENIIPIVGDYGSGKTSLCHKILYELSGKPDVIPFFIPLGQLPKHEDGIDNLLEDVFDYVKTTYLPNIEKKEFEVKMRTRKVVFILDALDEMAVRLDHQVAQNNLNNAVRLSKRSVVVLTGRHTYFTDKMEQLFEHDELIKILDFNDDEIQIFLHRIIPDNQIRIDEINKIISERKIEEFARKPLFLSIIYKHFNELNKHQIINEAIILQTLTEEWIKFDVEKKHLEIKRINERQRISEALAFAQYTTGRLISLDDVKSEVGKELHYDVEGSLNRYENDAVNSTFLVKEANDRYRFIAKPIVEYFFASRILDDIHKRKPDLISHGKEIKSEETFNFIRGLIEIRWAIKPHVLKKVLDSDDYNKLKEYVNDGHDLFERITSTRKIKPRENIANLLTILLKTCNLQERADLRDLEISGIDSPNVYLHKANLQESNLSGANLSGSDLSGANLSDARLFNAILIGANLSGANLTGANLFNVKLSGANLSGTILDATRFINVSAKEVIVNDETSVKGIVLVDSDKDLLDNKKRGELWKEMDSKLRDMIKDANPRYK